MARTAASSWTQPYSSVKHKGMCWRNAGWTWAKYVASASKLGKGMLTGDAKEPQKPTARLGFTRCERPSEAYWKGWHVHRSGICTSSSPLSSHGIFPSCKSPLARSPPSRRSYHIPLCVPCLASLQECELLECKNHWVPSIVPYTRYLLNKWMDIRFYMFI